MAAGNERDQAIGQVVTSLRGDRAQKAVADAMRGKGHRWSQATVWGVEKGDRPLKFVEAIDLAQVLQCTVDDFRRPPRTVELELWLRRVGASLIRRKDELEDAAVWFEDEARNAVDVIKIVTDEIVPDGDLLDAIEWIDDLAAKSAAEVVSGPMEGARAKYTLAMDGKDISGID